MKIQTRNFNLVRHLKKLLFCLTLSIVAPFSLFSQTGAGALRDYVGLINQTYHPGIIAIFEKIKADLTKEGATDAVKVIDLYLGGNFGSGFLYNDARGNLYVLTNNHVVSQAHTLSITFERQDGTKRKVENLRIIATDEENDLAILAIPSGGERPFATQGLTLLTRAIEEGEDVFSAGFPGLGITPIWQFGRGMISNSSTRFPKSLLDETLLGPFIQHTAQVDAGNSGGPLLVAQRNAPSGYAVAGINTLSSYSRQAANYAIPISTVRTFIDRSLNPRPDTFRAALDQRLEKFIEGLGANKAVYPHIAEFLSNTCIGENAEYAIDEMYEKGNRAVRRAFVNRLEESLTGAMSYAVAWTIENSIRSGGGVIRASIKEVTGSGEEYIVTLTINNKDVDTKWVREYGNWRIGTFGTVAAGDRSLIDKRERDRELKANLRIGPGIHVEAGYAYLFEYRPAAIYLSMELDMGLLGTYGLKFNFIDMNHYSIGGFFGYRFGIPAGSIGFIPFFRIGIDYQHDKENETPNSSYYDSEPKMVPPIALNAQIGLKVTTSHVPGLFFGVCFQHNAPNTMSTREYIMKMSLAFSVGYAF
ncbi:MAG: serine protease [Treponema sp.]|jgi:serine protease Do|nr:serine protease [Treponema sp.]